MRTEERAIPSRAPGQARRASVPVIAVLLVLGLAACGGAGEPTAAPAQAPGPLPAAPHRPTGPIDEHIAIDGGSLHLRCHGAGTTTVLLIAGWGAGDDGWGAVEPAVAETARVCAYARFGTGTSDPPPTTQTFATQAADLHELLEAAGEPGPYVVVGHSFGGAQAVTFAAQHPDEVAGLMLLDASPATWPATVCSVPGYAAGCAVMRDPSLDPERLDVFAAFEAVATVESLGELPMVVMTAAHRTAPELTAEELEHLDAVWAEGVDRWAGLSKASTVVTIDDTGHAIHLDQPEAVLGSLATLLAPG